MKKTKDLDQHKISIKNKKNFSNALLSCITIILLFYLVFTSGCSSSSEISSKKIEMPKIVNYGKQAENDFLSAEELNKKVDIKQAFNLYLKAANYGNINAQYKLGLLHNYGEGVKQNYSKAFEWFLLAAIQNNSDAQFELAVRFFKGEGISKNYDNAIIWATKAAKQNHPGAKAMLEVIDKKKPSMSAEEMENKAREFCKIEKNPKKGFEWHLKSSLAGNSKAMMRVVEHYYSGTGVKKNINTSIDWGRRASYAGNLDGISFLASNYMSGEHISKSIDMAIFWYSKSVAKGKLLDVFMLAHCFVEKKDYLQAIKWFEYGAQYDDQDSIFSLSALYFKGAGVEKDRKKGIKLLRRAAKLGHKEAIKILKKNDIALEENFIIDFLKGN